MVTAGEGEEEGRLLAVRHGIGEWWVITVAISGENENSITSVFTITRPIHSVVYFVCVCVCWCLCVCVCA